MARLACEADFGVRADASRFNWFADAVTLREPEIVIILKT